MNARLRGPVADAVRIADRLLSHAGARFERPSLLPFLFHSLFEDGDEVESDLVYPQEAITLAGLRVLVEDFLGRGYRFVSAGDIEQGLGPAENCVWLTFDDGYASNLRMVDLLREYGITATLFVATGYVASGRRFWWDTVYSERRRQGMPVDRIEAEIESLKRRELGDVESYLVREFGRGADRPRSELDRPLTPDELTGLARSDGVEIGNHTVDHAILPLLSSDRIEAQLRGAQEYLHELTGISARSVSYPNGGCDDRVLDVAHTVGFTVGVTTVPRKNRIPIPSAELLRLGRFQLVRRGDLRAQARVTRSELQLGSAARRLRRRMRR